MDNIIVSISGVSSNELSIQNGDTINLDISGVTPIELLVEGTPTVPTRLDQLIQSPEFRTVTDNQIEIWTGKQDNLGYIPENVAKKNAINGYAGLDANGFINSSALPTGSLKYKTSWNALTNTPELLQYNEAEVGNIYLVSESGEQWGISFQVGDWAVYGSDGYISDLPYAGNMVASVNGKTGAVILNTSGIPESINYRYVNENERKAPNNVINPLTENNPVADLKFVNDAISGLAYTNSNPMPSTVGGLEAGSTFEGVTIPQMFTQLLYPYQYPAFTSFSIIGQSTPIEVGNSISSNMSFAWASSNQSNIKNNSITINDITSSVTVASEIPNTGSFSSAYGPVTKTSATTNVFQIKGTNSKSQNFTLNYSVSWLFKKYYGESSSSSLNGSDALALRVNALSNSFVGSYSFVGGGYKYFVWSTTLGTASTFKDTSNNLAVPMQTPYTISITNSFGVSQNYYVYRTTNILGGSITIAVS